MVCGEGGAEWGEVLTENAAGRYLPDGQTSHIDKTFIKQRLAWITAARPTANPARGLLNAVNSVLMPN